MRLTPAARSALAAHAAATRWARLDPAGRTLATARAREAGRARFYAEADRRGITDPRARDAMARSAERAELARIRLAAALHEGMPEDQRGPYLFRTDAVVGYVTAAGGTARFAQIRKALKCTPGKLGRALHGLVASGRLVRVARGVYALPDDSGPGT
jgi:Transcriptional regulator, AbiEi antitoxin